MLCPFAKDECLEDDCALWDHDFNLCSFRSIAMDLATIGSAIEDNGGCLPVRAKDTAKEGVDYGD